jgi:hypothetical protein
MRVVQANRRFLVIQRQKIDTKSVVSVFMSSGRIQGETAIGTQECIKVDCFALSKLHTKEMHLLAQLIDLL